MKIFNLLLSLVLAWSLVIPSMAAIPKSPNLVTLNTFLTEGSFRGGKSGGSYSLLGVKRVYSPNGKSERLIFEMGDKRGQAFTGKPGYFHAQLFRNPSELSLDLSQVVSSKVNSSNLSQLIKTSKLIQNASLALDREDHSTHVSMRFKSPIKMRVYTLAPQKGTPKLVIDITKL